LYVILWPLLAVMDIVYLLFFLLLFLDVN
ncbi:DUF2770 domain-containing protein, partial [Salmonella enterica subsp. enterica serovar Typhimurium]